MKTRAELMQEWLLMPDYWADIDDEMREALSDWVTPLVERFDEFPSWPTVGAVIVASAFRT
jgi:hypothetical protein